MILVKITNQSIKESGNKGFLKEKETVWRLQISVLIDTNPWIDWDFYQFCKFSHHWITRRSILDHNILMTTELPTDK